MYDVAHDVSESLLPDANDPFADYTDATSNGSFLDTTGTPSSTLERSQSNLTGSQSRLPWENDYDATPPASKAASKRNTSILES